MMGYYRLYSLDPADEHIIDVAESHADSDSAAVLQVDPSASGTARELWNLGRKIADFPARNRAISPKKSAANLTRLGEAGRWWRWDPLAAHCQLVAYGLDRQSQGRDPHAKKACH